LPLCPDVWELDSEQNEAILVTRVLNGDDGATTPDGRSAVMQRSRRPRLLIIGCGDVGLRVLRRLHAAWKVYALTSSQDRLSSLRKAGAVPLFGDLDDPSTLGRLGGLAQRVLYLAPPPSEGSDDPRVRHALRALLRGGQVTHLVYASTTGVYGDCGGALIDETRALAPSTARAFRRVAAESRVRHFGRQSGAHVSILRIPGIYAPDREAGQPQARVLRGTPVLERSADVYSNHIHAEDLARACILALSRALPQRVINVCDDSDDLVGDYYDRVADICGLPRPRRVSRTQAQAEMSPMQWSFMNESRRIGNARLKSELRLRLNYPTVKDALA
jgi:nucleoside-diphosphate-sugar epimerase